jgi:hypothetical protein
VADAKPLIVLVVARTCFKSIAVIELAATDTSFANATSSNNKSNVAPLDAVLVITILVTIAVVDDGTVYSVVLDVDAAPRNRALLTVAISYYLS